MIALSCTPKTDAPDAGSRAAPIASVSAAQVASAPVPDVVSSASSIWEGGVPVVAAGEVDGDALRTRTRARIAGDTSAVNVVTGTKGPLDLGKRLCEAVVPRRPKETPILIKPNLGGFEWFKDPAKSGGDDGVHGRTTDVEFVRGIVKCLQARGHTKITIGEGFAHTHESWKKLVTVNGYDAMARAENVKLVAFDDDGVFDVEGDQPGKPLKVKGMEKTNAPTLLMPKVLAEHLEHGLFISAPKIKAHRFGVVTMAIKGMQGTVMLSDASPAFHQKWRMHKELSAALTLLKTAGNEQAGKKAYLDSLLVFGERMSDLLEVAAPHVTLAEGAPAMGGDGFGKRWPSDEDYAVGGTNPILVDRVGAQLLGLWDNADLAKELGGHKTSPLIEIAAKRFGVDIASPKIEGDGVALVSSKRPVHLLGMSGFSLLSDDKPPEPFPGAPRGLVLPEAHALASPDENIAWDKAKPVTFDTDWSGKPTGVKSRVRFAWSKAALWMRWDLEGAALNVDDTKPVKEERARLYEEDCVELFLGSDPNDRKKYWEVEVGPLGHFLDIAIDRGAKSVNKSDVGWSSASEIETTVDRDKKTAAITVAVRSPDVVKVLAAGARLPLGLYRMEGKAPGRLFLAWSPTKTPKPDFHVPDMFGTLILD